MVSIRRRAVVSGRVQGVFYRASARERAEALGVAGWARNRTDGRVELVAEGEPAAVDELLAWARTGPSGARVTEVQVTAEEPAGRAGFEVR